MNIDKLIVGPLATNCYLLSIEDEIVIIDPGDDFPKIKEKIGDKKVVGCLVTHFHQDHIGALEEVISQYDLQINQLDIPNFHFEIIETPGHTFDSRTFYFKNQNLMFTGDFIFNNGIGRTDLGGNMNSMITSLQEFTQYPDNTILYPGHGPSTTLGTEKENYSIYLKKS